MSRRRPTSKKPPDVFAWFFGYHVFDLCAARALASGFPAALVATVQLERLLADGAPDLDIARTCPTSAPGILARVPVDGAERFVLIDGFETAHRCLALGVPMRLRLLSRAEARLCRTADSLAEWPEERSE